MNNQNRKINITAAIGGGLPNTRTGRRIAQMFDLSQPAPQTLWDNFEMDISPGKIIVLTGPSGSGKSTLLKSLARKVRSASVLSIANLSRTRKIPADVLRGGTLTARLKLLSACGLSEARILVTESRFLSDGQKFRLALAEVIHRASDKPLGKRVVIADEFASSLDAPTARTLAIQIRKLVSRFGLSLVLSTPRSEVLELLRPDVLVVKPLGEPARMERNPSVWRSVREKQDRFPVIRGSIMDYRTLHQFHYLTKPPAAHKRVYIIPTPERFRRLGSPDIAASLVVSPPVLSCRARNISTCGRFLPGRKGRTDIFEMLNGFQQGRTRARNALNSELECISRVIVHPIFRGMGLASKLVRHAIATGEMPLMESLAGMGRFNPFLNRAGMTLCGFFRGRERYYNYYLSHTRQNKKVLGWLWKIEQEGNKIGKGHQENISRKEGSQGEEDKKS